MDRIPLAKPVMDRRMVAAASQALREDRLVGGEAVARFEEAFARYLGVDHAVAVSSGTHALQFALMAAGVGSGRRVVTSTNSFIASANAILHAGGEPVLADVDPDTGCLTPAATSKVLGGDTRFILPVHIYGHPCDMEGLDTIAERAGATLVEDAAQAHGASIGNRKVGSFGAAACFSFYPSKNMTVGGDGGAVSTNDRRIADAVRKLRDCGRAEKYVHDVVGYTARLNTANAAIGLEQLKLLDGWNERRRRHARAYARGLKGLASVRLPPMPRKDVVPVYHMFVIRAERRDELREWLAASGIDTGVHYPLPIHLQPVYRERYGFQGGEFPVAEGWAQQALSLPMYPQLTRKDVAFVCESVRAFYERE